MRIYEVKKSTADDVWWWYSYYRSLIKRGLMSDSEARQHVKKLRKLYFKGKISQERLDQISDKYM